MNKLRLVIQKILSIIRVRSISGGLEISDQVLRLVFYDGGTWRMMAIRLDPGTLEAGRIKNRDAFRAALHSLKVKASGEKSQKKMSVVIAMSSMNVYSQIFTLPIIEGGNLDDAIRLNLQMISPVDPTQSYAGWQLIRKDDEQLRYEIAAAFIDKAVIDEMATTLLEAGFIAVGVESRPLALMRVLREKGSGIDASRSYLLVNIDNSGLEFLVVRNGNLYFEYSNQWKDLADDKGQITVEKFEETLEMSLRQVFNFYAQHWPDPLSGVILSAVAFQEQAEKAIAEASQLPIIRLTLFMGQAVSSEWLVALGSSLRGFRSNAQDKEINLLGPGAQDAFRKEQIVQFLSFWRVVVPITLAVLIITFFLANNFLASTDASITSQSTFNLAPAQAQEINNLKASSTQFNSAVSLIAAIEQGLHPKSGIISKLNTMASAAGVTVKHINYPSVGAPLLVTGTANSQDQIIAFKNAIEASPSFGPVNLPLTSIQQNGSVYSFSMTFPASF